MAKINYVEINNTIRYIENVAFLQALPVANADSEDFVSVNNVLYVKQINNGVYSYAEVSGGTEIKSITFSAPSTATQGTITSSDLATLQENDQNYIIFNDEIFRLNDKQHESGYLVYSHNGHDTTGCFFQKCITITISTLGWVLESQENQPKLTAGTNITIENNVISASGGSGGGSSSENVLELNLSDVVSADDSNYDNLGAALSYFFFMYAVSVEGGSIGVSTPTNFSVNLINITDEQKNNIKTGVYDRIIITDSGASVSIVLNKVFTATLYNKTTTMYGTPLVVNMDAFVFFKLVLTVNITGDIVNISSNVQTPS